MKKGMLTGILTVSMILSLAGCGSANKQTTASTASESVSETVMETQSETVAETATETAKETETQTEAYNREKSIAAYQTALQNIYDNLTLPDGTELKSGELDDISANQFAIYDVDQDGRDELIFEYTETYMAAMIAKIYDYDETSDSLHEELSDFPALTFYDNATIGAAISHNQGNAGDFWPYTFYTYDAENDTYEAKYYVDAWDKSVSDVGYSGEVFPDEADKDGDGIVYYLGAPDSSEQGEPMDKDAYESWFSENTGSVEELPFQQLTQENINNIQ